MADEPVENTDRELWREREGDYYANSIHVTAGGGIGIDVGGYVIVMPLDKWHALAIAGEAEPVALVEDAWKTFRELGGPTAVNFRLAFLDAANDLVAALPATAGGGTGWRDVKKDPPPMDGTRILGAWRYRGGERAGQYEYGVSWFEDGSWHEHDYDTTIDAPDLWQPLPTPPSTEAPK
jgi:hypothetical protein